MMVRQSVIIMSYSILQSAKHPEMSTAPAVDMLGAQAPALIGTWMGARIIASYMKKHKDMKLKDLLEFTDYHVMLSESNYLAS